MLHADFVSGSGDTYVEQGTLSPSFTTGPECYSGNCEPGWEYFVYVDDSGNVNFLSLDDSGPVNWTGSTRGRRLHHGYCLVSARVIAVPKLLFGIYGRFYWRRVPLGISNDIAFRNSGSDLPHSCYTMRPRVRLSHTGGRKLQCRSPLARTF
jgi:hypothetical protein